MPDASADLRLRVIPLASIVIPKRRHRRRREDLIATLAASIKDRGLLNPITVRPHGPRRFCLAAGRHRLAAVKALGWSSVPARILSSGADLLAAELAEIDENLIRADLSPAERAAHQARRKAIYEKLNPETRRGALGRGGKKSRQNGDTKTRYTADIAAKTGRSERAVQREAQRGTEIRDVASLAGTSLDKGDELDALAKLGEVVRVTLIKRAVAGEKVSARTELKRAARAEKERSLADATKAASAQLGRAVFAVLYGDPPWRFEVYSEAGMDRAPENHYPTMTLEALKALELPAAKDAALFLWTTTPMLAHSLALLEAWRFQYKSHLVWIKDKAGTGYWSRNRHEILLIATRGNVPAPAPGTQPSSAIEAPLERHSEKPAIFAQIIAEMFPTAPRVELFARAPREGWSVWGNEAEKILTTERSGDRNAKRAKG